MIQKKSLSFCEDELAAMKLKADDIKGECCSNTDNLRKRNIYLEAYSRFPSKI